MPDRRESRRVLGALEAAVMDVLWSTDQALSVRQVLDSVNAGRTPPLAYTTVMTVLTRLTDKGVLARTAAGRGFAYSPALGDEAAIAVSGVVRDYGEAALAHFVEEARSDPKLLRRLRSLMSEGSP